jgi:hypothetical protein
MMMRACRTLALTACATLVASAVSAQNQMAARGDWRLGAATGAYAPFSSLIKTADSRDTHLAAGPAFSLDLQYQAIDYLSVYGNGMISFGTITLGSAIRPAVLGPSDQVTMIAATAGVLLAPTDWFGEHLQPTLRLGGGLKSYSFDLVDTDGQARLTGDIGLGLRGMGLGVIDVTAEVRYLPSSFDQAKLPIRGIAPQDQRQNDLVFAIGVGIRL